MAFQFGTRSATNLSQCDPALEAVARLTELETAKVVQRAVIQEAGNG